MASHKRTDSGIARPGSPLEVPIIAPDEVNLQQIQRFIDAASEMSACDGYDIIVKLLTKQQGLEREIQSHGRVVRRLHQNIDELHASLERSNKQVLELEETRMNLESLRLAKAESDSHIQELGSTLETSEIVKRDQANEIKALQQSLETANYEVTKLEENRNTQRSRAEAAERRVEQLQRFRVQLQPEDPNKTTAMRLKTLWASLHKFSKSHFCVDLPEAVLQDETAWTGLDKAFSKAALPRTNSQDAKNMRFAAVLSLLADKIVGHLFHPNYSLNEENGMRQALIEQAETDSDKEKTFRSMLLELLSDQYPLRSNSRRQKTHREIWTALAGLCDNERRVADELLSCVRAAQDFWDVTKTREDLYFFTFKTCFEGDQEPAMKLPGESAGNNQSGAASHQVISDLDVALVVFPHLYTVDKQVMPGLVIRRYQVQGAQEENEKLARKITRHTSTSKAHTSASGRS